MDFWTLRRHILELAERTRKPLFLDRTVHLATGGIGLLLSQERNPFCWEIVLDPPRQWIRETSKWEEEEREGPFVREINRAIGKSRILRLELMGWDRVILVRIRKKESFFGEMLDFSLIIELTGRVSNIILFDKKSVIAQYHETGNNRVGQTYQPPGTGERKNHLPPDLPVEGWRNFISDLTPLMNREFLFRAGKGNPEDILRDLLQELEQGKGPVQLFCPIKNPCASKYTKSQIRGQNRHALRRDKSRLYMKQDISLIKICCNKAQTANQRTPGPSTPGLSSPGLSSPDLSSRFPVVSPIALGHFPQDGEIRWFNTVNEALSVVSEEYFIQDQLEKLRIRAEDKYRRELEKVQERIQEQNLRLENCDHPEKWKKLGDLVLQNLMGIPAYSTCVMLKEIQSGEEFLVELDPRRKPAENADRFFHLYKKAKRGKLEVENRLKVLRGRETWLQEQLLFCVQAESAEELSVLISQITEKNLGTTPKKRKIKLEPFLEKGNCRFYVGKNARNNQTISFSIGKKGDFWFHAFEVPGSHVLAKKVSGEFCDEDILIGAQLAAYFSFARQSGKVAVDYTDIANLRKIPGGEPGQVYYKNQKTIYVSPQSALELLQSR